MRNRAKTKPKPERLQGGKRDKINKDQRAPRR